MLGPLDYMLWLIGFLAEIGVLVYLLSRKQVFRNFPIVFYMLCDALVTCGLYYCVQHFGFNSSTYSYAVVHENRAHLATHFVVEMSQNVYFVGVVLTYLLWGAILKLRETRTRLIQLVLALGIYFSANAGSYAL